MPGNFSSKQRMYSSVGGRIYDTLGIHVMRSTVTGHNATLEPYFLLKVVYQLTFTG